jgi:hypothetical protein
MMTPLKDDKPMFLQAAQRHGQFGASIEGSHQLPHKQWEHVLQ